MKPPAFQFYADDFLGGTFAMTLPERGLYITLLCLQWNAGGITEEDFNQMAQPLDSHSSARVRRKFQAGEDGLLRNARMEVEREKQAAFRANRSASGKAGAEKRWLSHSTAIAQPMANDSSPSPSPSPSPISGCTEKKGAWLTVPLLLQELGAVYGRPLNQWPTDTEQRAAVELLKRPNLEEEKTIVIEFARRVKPEDKKFEFPKTLFKLLESWSEALDKARTYYPVDVRQAAKISDAKQLVASMFKPNPL